MSLSWSDLREWGPFFVACIPNIVLAVQWAMRKEFATTDAMLSVHKVLDDRHRELAADVVRAHHRLDLLEKDLKGLPDYDTTNEIKEDLVAVKETQAGTNTEIRMLREMVARIDDYLRQGR